MYIRSRGDAAGVGKINRKVVVVWMELPFQQYVLIYLQHLHFSKTLAGPYIESIKQFRRVGKRGKRTA